MYDIIVRIDGDIIESNFDEVADQLIANVKGLNMTPRTDEEFAEAETMVKNLRAGEKAIDAAKKKAMENTADIRKLFEAMDRVKNEVRSTRLALAKAIKEEKASRLERVIAEQVVAVQSFINETREKFKPHLQSAFTVDEDAIRAATKNKKKLTTAKAAAEKAAIEQMNRVKKLAQVYGANLDYIKSIDNEFKQLFVLDLNKILQTENHNLFRDLVANRIAAYQAEQARIRAQIEEKEKHKMEEEQRRREEDAHKQKTEEDLGANTAQGAPQEAPESEPEPEPEPDPAPRRHESQEPQQEAGNESEDVIKVVIKINVTGRRNEVTEIAKVAYESIKNYIGVEGVKVEKR